MVEFTRASGPRPGRREWQLVQTQIQQDLAGTGVLFGCLFCGALGIIGPPAPVTADGMVAQLVSCSSGHCEWSFQAYLKGWAERSKESPVSTATEAATSLCQADGADS